MSFKEHSLYKLLRSPLVKWRIYKSFFYDARRYIKYSNTIKKDKSHNNLVATIIKAYHVVEKGLTMPEMREGFGQEKILFLINKCFEYKRKYNKSNHNVDNAVKVIFEYCALHKSINYELNKGLTERILKLENEFSNLKKSEQETITPQMVANYNKLSFKDFSFSRSSLRNYSNENIEIETIYKSIEIAQNSPSACNRQPSRVHVYSNKEDIENILKLQNGNSGFGHLSNKLIVLTTDLSGYHTHKERYINWVDGGIYLMNLVYALHFHKIGSCILNWGVDKNIDEELRKISNIDKNETVIAVISCGYYMNEACKVAKSPKREVEEVITVH